MLVKFMGYNEKQGDFFHNEGSGGYSSALSKKNAMQS